MAVHRFPASSTRAGRCAHSAVAAAVAALCAGLPAVAGAQAQAADTTVTITGRSLGAATLGGWGSVPLARLPLQAGVFGQQQLADAGVASIGGLTRLDASLADAYNAEGYWSILAARGYTIDNRYNYRRDGLPINAETAIALDNKDRIELVKGTSGIQAGTSAPGGLVNLVVKRPVGTLRSARVELRQSGSLLGAVDIGERFGPDGAIGIRINAAAERLDPQVRNTRGERALLAAAADWQLGPDTLLQAEVEASRQSQPSVAGYSLLGDNVPAADSIDPRRNLNDQPWRQPVVLAGTTASLRWQQRLAEGWRLTAQAMQQRLRSDDRTAFPYGVYDANYACPAWCDRYAPDGSFTYWQFVSDGERRTTDALAASLAGELRTAGLRHAVEAGVLVSRYRARFNDQVYDIAGTGHIDGSLQTPPSPGGTDANTDRDERSTELHVRDAVDIGERWQLWAGLRHTRLDRAARRTSAAAGDPDGLRATRYDRSETTPWLALSYRLGGKTVVYASWGEGLETDVAPNRSRYVNPGESFPLRSRQWEAGIKHGTEQVEAALTVFDIDRGQTADVGACDADASCTRVADGSARHRGVEAQWTAHAGPWSWRAGAMLLDAERRGSATAAVNGSRPVNVPAATLRLGTEYRPAALPGLALLADLAADSDRVVLPYDESVRIPGYSQLALGARWRQVAGASVLVWRLGVDNATDRRAWKESPYQFSHAYLYPLPPRTWRASVTVGF